MGDLIWVGDGLDDDGLGLTRDITWSWTGPEDPAAGAEPGEVPQSPVGAPAVDGNTDGVEPLDPVQSDPPEPEASSIEVAAAAAAPLATDQAPTSVQSSVPAAESDPITYFLVDARGRRDHPRAG